MNLIPCQDCGRQISPNATSCPHCGGPVTAEYLRHLNEQKERKNKTNTVLGIFLGIFCLGVWGICHLATAPTTITPPKESKPAATKIKEKSSGGKSILATIWDEVEKKPRTQREKDDEFIIVQHAVKEAKKVGLVYKIQCQSGNVFVYPHKWKALNYDGKENFTIVMESYCGYTKEMDSSYIEIKNSKNGKILAKSTLSGKIKLY